MEENLRMYDKYVDNDGKTTLNQTEYMEMRKIIAKKKKDEEKVKTSNKKKQGKL